MQLYEYFSRLICITSQKIKIMKTNLLALLAAGLFMILTSSACMEGQHVVTGSKNYITHKVEPASFNAITVAGSPNVTYHQGSQNYIELYGSDNIIPLLETYVEDNTLIIKFKKNVSIRNGKLDIKVFSPDLNRMTINGSGNVYIPNGINTQEDIAISINGSGDIEGKGLNCRKMSVAISGSGDVRLQQIKSEECAASIAGSGNISLNGQALTAKYNISGSGNIVAAGLEAKDVSAHIADSGNISCHASGKLSGHVAGSGDIAYKGNPQEIDGPQKRIRQIR